MPATPARVEPTSAPSPLTPARLAADEALRRREFPVVADRVYLAHAAVGPLPGRVLEAVTDYAASAARSGQFEHLHRDAEAEVRARAARRFGADPEEIALVPSTSAGLATIAGGLDWKEGDSVVIAPGDFPGNLYPWMDLARRGVRIKWLPKRPDGAVDPGDLAAALDARTKVAALSSAHFVSGAGLELDAVGKVLADRGVLFCLDAIQTLGAFPTAHPAIDFAVADGHKWLLAPQGVGVMMVRRRHFARLHPTLVGWRSVARPNQFARPRLELADTARRYEPGSVNAIGVAGLAAALRLLDEAGPAAVAARISDLRDWLIAGLRERGCPVVGDPHARGPSGIVSFLPPDGDAAAAHRRLDRGGIILSLREAPDGRRVLRAAPHFYNSEPELDRLVGEL